LTAEDQASRIAFFRDSVSSPLPGLIIPLVAALLFGAALVLVYRARKADSTEAAKMWAKAAIAAWTFIPPLWFIGEYFVISHCRQWWPENQLPNVEAFKYSQELARNLWIAGAAALLAWYTRHLGGPGG